MKACLNLKPELRPNITQIYQIATQMHQHFQSLGNMQAPVTPSMEVMEMQQT